MILGARFLVDVVDVNHFGYEVQAVEFTESDAGTIYFQLLDTVTGRRYMPAAGCVLTCVIDNIDQSKRVTRVATQPFAQDASIFALQVMNTDGLRGTANLKMTLQEGAALKSAFIRTPLRWYAKDDV